MALLWRRSQSWRHARPNVLLWGGAGPRGDALSEALWTSQDVADFLQVSLRWVEKQRALSVLPCLPLPGRRLVRYDPSAIRAWAMQRAREGRAARMEE